MSYTSAQIVQAVPVGSGPPGLVVVQNETAFTTATQVVANAGIFTSTFTCYKIVLRFTGTAGGAFGLKLRVASTPSSTNYNHQILSVGSTTVSGVRQTAQTSFPICAGSGGSFMQSVECFVTGPALAEATTFQSNFQGNDVGFTVPFIQFNYGHHSTATAHDSFELNAPAGGQTFTGVYTVYGLAKTGA